MLFSQVRKRRCAQCYGRVYIRDNDEGEPEIYCPKNCEPGGHVSAGFVERQLAKDREDLRTVEANYPHLSDRAERDVDSDIQELYGKEE